MISNFSISHIRSNLQSRGSFNKNFIVRSIRQGKRVIEHPIITKNWKKSLRVKPKYKKAVLIPCAATKPFPQSPSHKHGYLEALKDKNVDIYVVSEPLGIVPYSWSRNYPNDAYDFPPKFLKDQARSLLIDRFSKWNDRVGKKYNQIYLALPGHHMDLVKLAGIQGRDVSISKCRENYCGSNIFRATSDEYISYLKDQV